MFEILAVLPSSTEIYKLDSKNLRPLSASANVSFLSLTGFFPCLTRNCLISELVICRLSQRGAFLELGIRLIFFYGFGFCYLTFYFTFVRFSPREGRNINCLMTSLCFCECLLCSKISGWRIGKFTSGELGSSLPNYNFS